VVEVKEMNLMSVLKPIKNVGLKILRKRYKKKAKESNWKQFHLIGEREEVEHLKSYFTRKIDKIVPRNLLGRNANQIIEETFK